MAEHHTELVIVDGSLTALLYRDNILEPVVLLFLQQYGQNVIFQQDNARPHAARVVSDFLEQNDVNVLPWPAVSPDLSPIEHVWDEMDRRLRRLPQQLRNNNNSTHLARIGQLSHPNLEQCSSELSQTSRGFNETSVHSSNQC